MRRALQHSSSLGWTHCLYNANGFDSQCSHRSCSSARGSQSRPIRSFWRQAGGGGERQRHYRRQHSATVSSAWLAESVCVHDVPRTANTVVAAGLTSLAPALDRDEYHEPERSRSRSRSRTTRGAVAIVGGVGHRRGDARRMTHDRRAPVESRTSRCRRLRTSTLEKRSPHRGRPVLWPPSVAGVLDVRRLAVRLALGLVARPRAAVGACDRAHGRRYVILRRSRRSGVARVTRVAAC